MGCPNLCFFYTVCEGCIFFLNGLKRSFYDHLSLERLTRAFLTVLGIEVGEAELGTFGGDEDLSVQGENHGLVLHVDHASHHVPRVPAAPEQTAARVQTVTL